MRCSGCSTEKGSESFSRNRTRISGYSSYCKVCMSGYYDPEKQKIASRKSHQRHKVRRNEQMRVNSWKKNGLDLTFIQWEQFLDEHGRQCEYPGCLVTDPLSPDHDHTTGELRGILCRKHNRALGNFGDDIEGLQRAIDYLVMTKERREASVANSALL